LCRRGSGRNCGLFRDLGLVASRRLSGLAGSRRCEPDRLWLAPGADRLGLRRARLRSLRGRLHRGVRALDVAGRRRATRPLGPHRRRRLPCGRGPDPARPARRLDMNPGAALEPLVTKGIKTASRPILGAAGCFFSGEDRVACACRADEAALIRRPARTEANLMTKELPKDPDERQRRTLWTVLLLNA